MGWRRDEVWFEVDVLWFREQQRQPFAAIALELPALPSFSSPAETGLDVSRRRRMEAQAARKRRLATRTVPAVALVLGSASSTGRLRSARVSLHSAVREYFTDPRGTPERRPVALAARTRRSLPNGIPK